MTNPFDGARFYLNVDYVEQVRKSAARHGGVLGQKMLRVAEQPTFLWLDSIAAIHGGVGYSRSLVGHLDQALQQKANAVGLVIYNLPNRDGAAAASNGELLVNERGLERYRSEYIDAIARVIHDPRYAGLRFILVIEPDSLPNLVTNRSLPRVREALESGAYVQGIQYAVSTLRRRDNVFIYLDVGHAAWLGWEENFRRFVDLLKDVCKGIRGGSRMVDGLISNTANYNPFEEPFLKADEMIAGMPVRSLAGWYDWNPFIDERSYATALREALVRGPDALPSSLGLLIDTSRNGWGGPQRPKAASQAKDLRTYVRESTIDRRIHKGNWANQVGSGIGARPTARPAPHYHAFVWVKPPGESDGSSRPIPKGPDNPLGKGFDPMCDPEYAGDDRNGRNRTGALPNAPPAGHWFDAFFVQLVENAYPPLEPVRPSER